MPSPRSHAGARRLRRELTEVENRLWSALRSRQHGFKFRRQHPIPPYVADFACIEARLVVELDGGQHGGAADAARDAKLVAMGWLVLRYWNSDVADNLDGVLADIVARVGERLGQTG
ncbi:MAG: primosomal protein [Pseudomonadota bacterium]|jgi:primosomal protein N' (replication factor Y)